MKKLLLAILAILALSISLTGASAVTFSTNELELCATDTGLFTFTVLNQGNFQDSYTVALSGDASRWAVATPSGFSLKQGEHEIVYIYVTPSLAALPGTYDLKVTVSAVGGTDTGSAKVVVKDCHSASLSAVSTKEVICSATKATYDLVLENTGKYTENFVLTLSGPAAKWSVVSEELVRLAAGESTNVKVTASPPADQTGVFSLTVTAASQNSNTVAQEKLEVDSDACYGFDASAELNYVSFCENSEVRIPLAIDNEGSVDNIYNIKVQGPSWAVAENSQIAIPALQGKFTNIVLFPGFGVAGDFPIKVRITSEQGSDVSESEIVANVKTCHAADVKLSVTEDTICPNIAKAYSFSVANTGEATAKFALTAEGAAFAKLDEDFVELAGGESKEFNLLLTPKDIDVGNHRIKVKAAAQDASKTSAESGADIRVASMENCFGLETTAALSKVVVAPGEPAVIPIIVENKGLENNTYNLEVSGTGAQFVQLNPASLSLQGKSARTVYAYVAVPESTAVDLYKVTVAARLEDGTTSSTTSFDIVISKDGTVPDETLETNGTTANARLAELQKQLQDFFNDLAERWAAFVAELQGEQPETDDESDEMNDTESNDTEEAEGNDTAELEINNTEEPGEGNASGNGTGEIPLGTEGEGPEGSEGNGTEENGTEANGTESETGSGFNILEEVRKKLEENQGDVPETGDVGKRLENSFADLTGGFSGIAAFLTDTTYYNVPNWLFIIAVIIIVSGISYALRNKELVEKFNKFLDEEEGAEKKGDSKNNKGGKKGPSAQELLEEAEKKNKKKGKK